METEILSVEDKKDAREELEEMLQDEGYTVRSEPSAESAVNWIFNGHDEIGVILMDIKMAGGGLDGIEAAREIQERNREIPIVFVSAFTEDFPVFKERADEAHLRVAGWIEKPLVDKNMKALLNVVDREFKKLHMRLQFQDTIRDVVGAPARMRDVLAQLAESYDIPLLIATVKDIGWIDQLDAVGIGDMVGYLNYVAYQKQKKTLKKSAGQFVAFLDGEPVGSAKDRGILVKQVFRDERRADFLVVKIADRSRVIKHRRPRSVRRK